MSQHLLALLLDFWQGHQDQEISNNFFFSKIKKKPIKVHKYMIRDEKKISELTAL